MSSDTNPQFGLVKWFNHTRGFGFISLVNENTKNDEQTDIFIHHSNLLTQANIYKTLSQGEYVQLEIKKDNNGKEYASNVSGLFGGPLMCESQRTRFRESSEDSQNEVNTEGRTHGKNKVSN